MSAHDMVIDNGDGATVRADINAALAALVSNNAGTSAPGTTYAHMWWTDTTTNKLKLRNAANSAWIEVLPDITAAYGGLLGSGSIGSTIQAYHANLAALAGLSLIADRLPYANGTGTLALATLTSAARNLLDDADAATMRTTLGLIIGTDVQAYDADTLKADVEDQGPLTGGARVTSKDLGTISSGTVTPDSGDRALQHYVNGGAHTLAPGSNTGAYLIDITNNGSAGAITTSGWTKIAGDAFTTTNAHKFRCHASVGNGGSLLIVQALQ